MKRLLLLAGEESGVLYAKRIAAKVRERSPDVEIRGYGDYGFETGDLAVFGVFAVLRRIFFFLRVKRTMERAIDEWRPDVVCTVDYPGMNLKLAAYAKAKDIRAVHVVCPQVWAWHQGRIPKIEDALDKLCCFFPFEPKIFRDGFAEFVGHPLAGQDEKFGSLEVWKFGGLEVWKFGRDALVASELKVKGEGEQWNGSSLEDEVEKRVGVGEWNGSSLDEKVNGEGEQRNGQPVVAILPGSRLGEIARILPTLLKAANEIAAKFSDVKFVIPAANVKAKKKIEEIIRHYPLSSVNYQLLDGGARALLGRATCAVVASGTATLEAALARCPTVLVYRVGAVTAAIARRVIKGVKHVGLANVIAEKAGVECPMPELLQEDFTVEAVVGYLEKWLGDSVAREEASAKLDRTMALLKSGNDPIGRIAEIIMEMPK